MFRFITVHSKQNNVRLWFYFFRFAYVLLKFIQLAVHGSVTITYRIDFVCIIMYFRMSLRSFTRRSSWPVNQEFE